jgi:GTP cyclohydrolase I
MAGSPGRAWIAGFEHLSPKQQLEVAVEIIIGSLGYDTEDQHFIESPERVAESLLEYALPAIEEERTLQQLLGKQFVEPNYDEMIIMTDLPFTSMCSHHMLPFIGKGHIGYIPEDGRLVGISKLPRLLEYFARRLTLQERVTYQVTQALERYLQPKGVIVVLESEHMCSTTRGAKAVGGRMITSMVRGAFLDNRKASRDEFMALVRRSRT